MHLAELKTKTLRRLFTQKKKSKGTGMEGGLEKYHFLLFLRIHNLIHNHDAEVHAPVASCSLILATSFSLPPRRWILKSLFWPENAIGSSPFYYGF